VTHNEVAQTACLEGSKSRALLKASEEQSRAFFINVDWAKGRVTQLDHDDSSEQLAGECIPTILADSLRKRSAKTKVKGEKMIAKLEFETPVSETDFLPVVSGAPLSPGPRRAKKRLAKPTRLASATGWSSSLVGGRPVELSLDSEASSNWAPGIEGSVHKSTVAAPIVDPVEVSSYRHGAELPAEPPNYGEKLLRTRFVEPPMSRQQNESAWTGNGIRRRLGAKSERDGR
jgi:hypothetical protein